MGLMFLHSLPGLQFCVSAYSPNIAFLSNYFNHYSRTELGCYHRAWKNPWLACHHLKWQESMRSAYSALA